MLDDLLGRTSLKERIEALQDERARLQAQLEAENQRRREAVREKQSADEQLNRLEDRIADLEGQLAKQEGPAQEPAFRRVRTVPPGRAGHLLDYLASVRSSPEGCFSAYLEAGTELPGFDGLLEAERSLLERARPCLLYLDECAMTKVMLDPPLPPEPFETWADRFQVDKRWFLPTGRFSLALVRSDLFAIGHYDGPDRTGFEGFESEVKSAHSKGGFSQARFDRLRDEQIDRHLEQCRSRIQEVADERLIIVGQRPLLAEFRSDALATLAVDAIGSPEAALGDAFDQFWRTRYYVW